MKIKLILIFFTAIYLPALMASGDTRGGGGDSIKCTNFYYSCDLELKEIENKIKKSGHLESFGKTIRVHPSEENFYAKEKLVKEYHRKINKCRSSDEYNSYKGTYSLDYLQTNFRKKVTSGNDFTQATLKDPSCAGYLRKIAANLWKSKYPILGFGLSEYIDSYEQSKGNYIKNRRWLRCSGKDCLNDLKDEGHKRNIATNNKKNFSVFEKRLQYRLPPNCTSKEQFARRVVDKSKNGETQITYHISQNVLNRLNRTDPLQCSYSLLHEWLRDIEVHADKIYEMADNLHKEVLNKADITIEFGPKLTAHPKELAYCKPNAANENPKAMASYTWNEFKAINENILRKYYYESVFKSP